MRKTYKAGLSLVIALCVITQAFAQDDAATDSKRRLMQFAANNQAFDATIEDLARGFYRKQIPGCATIDQAVRQLPTPYGLLSFPANAGGIFPPPENGLWAEHVKIRGCGKIWQVNMLGVGQRDSKPLVLALLPGETLSDPASQGTAERLASTAIRKADASCADDPKANYTRLLGFKQADGSMGKTDAQQGWFEEWTFKFCQKTVPAQLAFMPDGTGGFSIKARIVGNTPPQIPQTKPAQTPAATTP